MYLEKQKINLAWDLCVTGSSDASLRSVRDLEGNGAVTEELFYFACLYVCLSYGCGSDTGLALEQFGALRP